MMKVTLYANPTPKMPLTVLSTKHNALLYYKHFLWNNKMRFICAQVFNRVIQDLLSLILPPRHRDPLFDANPVRIFQAWHAHNHHGHQQAVGAGLAARLIG